MLLLTPKASIESSVMCLRQKLHLPWSNMNRRGIECLQGRKWGRKCNRDWKKVPQEAKKELPEVFLRCHAIFTTQKTGKDGVQWLSEIFVRQRKNLISLTEGRGKETYGGIVKSHLGKEEKKRQVQLWWWRRLMNIGLENINGWNYWFE